MMEKKKQMFLDTVPVSELTQYKKCLNKGRGRPTNECSPLMKEYKNFVNKQKVKRIPKPKSASNTKPSHKSTHVSESKPSKPMTIAKKCKKTSIAECEKPCKVFKTPSGEYCRKPKSKAKKSSKQEKKTLSMMA